MNTLTIYNQSIDISALDRKDLAPGTLRHYKAAIALLLASNVNITNRDELVCYVETLPRSGRANLKAALSILLDDYVDMAKVSNAPIETIQRFVWLVDVVKKTMHVKKQSTERKPHWLSQAQVDRITSAALSNSLRDYIIMGLLLGGGLRREELEELTFDALSQIPHKGQIKDILTIRGKGDTVRTVYIAPILANHLREWKSICKGGRIARRIHKGGKVGDSLSAYRIFVIVRQYGQIINVPDLDPHDCRRSYGRLLYEATNNIVMVQQLLGHSNVKTTQTYIGLNINLDIPADAFPVGRVSGD
jgi:integrase